MRFQVAIAFTVVLGASLVAALEQPMQQPVNITAATRRLYTYAGPLLPPEWTLVSIWNDRALIGFSNGSARNSLIEELNIEDRIFLRKLQDGTLTPNPLKTAKETVSNWTSTITSTIGKYGGSLKDQLEKLIKDNYKGGEPVIVTNKTTITTTIS